MTEFQQDEHHSDDSVSTCPISGLPVIEKSEWTDIVLSDRYQVTFKFLGERILFVVHKGTPDEESIAALLQHRQKVIADMLGEDTFFVEMVDVSGLGDALSRNVRQQTTDALLTYRHRLLGFIVINASVKMQLALNVGQRLYRPFFPVLSVRNYETAITRALSLLEQDQRDPAAGSFPITRKKEWELHNERGSIIVELVNGNIIYCENTGDLGEADVLASLDAMGELAASLARRTKEYWVVVVPQPAKLSRVSRNHYIRFLEELYTRQPFGAFILCRANRFFQNVLQMARPRVRFPALLARDLPNALTLINKTDKELASERLAVDDRGEPEPVRGMVSELLNYLGSINWETEGQMELPDNSEDDPLQPVYEAIYLIKADLDDLLHKRQEDQQALRENIEQQSSIIETINDGYFECDLAGTATLVNNSLCEMYGYSRDEFIGLGYRQYMSPETASVVKKAFNEIYRTGRSNRSLEYQVICKDGTPLIVETSVSLITDLQGHVTGFRGIVRDITERRKNEEQLQMFRRFIEASGEGMGWSDQDGRIIYANATLCRILGEDSLEAVQGKRVADYCDQPTRRQMKNTILPVARRDGEWKGEVTIHNQRGQQVPTLNDVFFIADEAGHLRYHATITRDISDLKNAEKALRESEEKYRLLVNHATDAICIAQDGVIKFANPRLVALTEYPLVELSRRPFVDLIHPDDVPVLLERYQRRLDGEVATGPYTFRAFSKSGKLIWMQDNAVRINWEGRPAILNFIRDITLQKKMEEQLRQSLKMEAIGTLAGGIAHDFNNILAAVMGYTEVVLGETTQGTRAHRNLRQIRKAVMRARELVRQILTFSRPGDESVRPLQFVPIVKEVLKMLQAAAPANIDIVQEIPQSSATVLADPTQIHEVVMNLCTNAIQAMSAGGSLRVGVSSVELDPTQIPGHKDISSGPFVKLEIADTGSGMPPEVGARIFEPYFSTREHAEGTGLGLSVVHGIVDTLGGFITVDSREGAGSLFTVYLPVTDMEESRWESVSPDRHLPGGEGRILLVDNDPQLLDSGQQLLEQLGYRVKTAPDPLAALDLLQQENADFRLVIADMVMPKMAGDELAREIFKSWPDMPVILCSGNEIQVSDIDETMVRKCLAKPFAARDLAWAIRDVLDEGGQPVNGD